MSELKEFEMTQEDCAVLLEACRSVPAIMLQCGMPSSPQENANRAWRALGEKMGFVWDTVEPVPNKNSRFFRAVATGGAA